MTKTAAVKAPAVTITGDVQTSDGEVITEATRQAWLAFLSVVFGGTFHVAWWRAGYVMLRGDAGKGPRPAGIVLADGTAVGAPWVTVCVHGSVRRAAKGAAAEQAGRDRATWCDACSKGAPATVAGLPGAAPAPAPAKAPKAPRKPRTKAAAAPAEAPAPAAPAAPAEAPAPAE